MNLIVITDFLDADTFEQTRQAVELLRQHRLFHSRAAGSISKCGTRAAAFSEEFSFRYSSFALHPREGFLPKQLAALEKVRDRVVEKYCELVAPEEAERATLVACNATLFERGDFISWHTDGDGNSWAYSLYLSELSGDGGELVFDFEEGRPVTVIRPRPNTIVYFRVPTRHAVMDVEGEGMSRYAISGWLQ